MTSFSSGSKWGISDISGSLLLKKEGVKKIHCRIGCKYSDVKFEWF